MKRSIHSLAVTAVLMAVLVASGCATRAVRPVVQGPPPPQPNSPAAVLRVLDWCYDNRAVGPYAEILTEDFEFLFSVLDSTGAHYRTDPWGRDEELLYASRLFAAADSISLLLDRNFLVLPDPRFQPSDPVGRWHKIITTNFLLSIREHQGGESSVTGQATFYCVRGDSARIPQDLMDRGLGPDSTRWWIQRWDDDSGSMVSWGAIKHAYRTMAGAPVQRSSVRGNVASVRSR